VEHSYLCGLYLLLGPLRYLRLLFPQ